MIVFGIVGWKNSGKTFLVKKIIKRLCSLDLKVASIKHAHHNFEIDYPDTDSFLHRQAGSQEVVISSSKRWAKIVELNNSIEKNLNELIKELDSPQVVIIEGYKNENHPKIEIIRDKSDTSKFLFKNIKNITAIVSESHIEIFKKKQFKINQIDEIVNHILNYKNE